MRLFQWIDRLAIVFVLLMILVVAVYLPVMLKTEAECLRQGFPKYSVSVGLESYCLNLQGVVTTVVVPQK